MLFKMLVRSQIPINNLHMAIKRKNTFRSFSAQVLGPDTSSHYIHTSDTSSTLNRHFMNVASTLIFYIFYRYFMAFIDISTIFFNNSMKVSDKNFFFPIRSVAEQTNRVILRCSPNRLAEFYSLHYSQRREIVVTPFGIPILVLSF